MVNEEIACGLGDGIVEALEGVGAGVGVGIIVAEGWGVGETEERVNFQILLQSLQVPVESFTFTFQNHKPSDKEGV